MICKSCFLASAVVTLVTVKSELYRQWTFHRVIYCSNVSEVDKEID